MFGFVRVLKLISVPDANCKRSVAQVNIQSKHHDYSSEMHRFIIINTFDIFNAVWSVMVNHAAGEIIKNQKKYIYILKYTSVSYTVHCIYMKYWCTVTSMSEKLSQSCIISNCQQGASATILLLTWFMASINIFLKLIVNSFFFITTWHKFLNYVHFRFK